MNIRLLIAEPQQVVRLGLHDMLAESEVSIVDVAITASAALELTSEHQPDLLMVELNFEDMDALQLISRVKFALPEQRMLIFSGYDNAHCLARAAALGVEGFLDKRCTRPELLRAIRQTARGGQHWPRCERRRLSTALASPVGFDNIEAWLSQRELNVLREIIKGTNNDDIAQTLSLSPDIVKTESQKVFRKIGVEDRTQAALWAVRKGLI